MALPASDSAIRVSIDNLLEGVQILSYDWTYLYVNDVAARHGRQSVRSLVGRRITACYPGIEATDMFKMLDRVMQSRQSERMVNEFSYANGARGWFELSVEPVPDGICVLSIDVTERRAAELELRQVQKMEAVGQLASGVAHDFNNMLTAILGYAELISAQIGPDKPIGRDVDEIVSAAERGAALARQLLGFSRRTSQRVAPLNLAAVVEGLQPMLRRLLRENIAITTSFDPATYPVVGNVQQLEQVLMNLVINARDAMTGGGTITIATGNVTLDDHYLQNHPGAIAGEHAVLSVADTGCGMTPEVRARIFEPFYTTKAEGLGTGLGLAVVLRMVRELGGDIWVYTEAGHGTVIKVYLPKAQGSVATPAARVRTASPVGSEAVLLVEDEPGVRSFVKTVLERYGYVVSAVPSGEAAIHHVATSERAPDLLLTDLMLPGFDGRELARRLASERQTMRVVYMSGYAEPVDGSLSANAAWLEKPFTAHGLLTRVRDVLDGPPP